jgi:hypothetical protein
VTPRKHGALRDLQHRARRSARREFGVKKAVEDLTPEDYRTFIEKTARRMLRLLDDVRPAS